MTYDLYATNIYNLLNLDPYHKPLFINQQPNSLVPRNLYIKKKGWCLKLPQRPKLGLIVEKKMLYKRSIKQILPLYS